MQTLYCTKWCSHTTGTLDRLESGWKELNLSHMSSKRFITHVKNAEPAYYGSLYNRREVGVENVH